MRLTPVICSCGEDFDLRASAFCSLSRSERRKEIKGESVWCNRVVETIQTHIECVRECVGIKESNGGLET